MHGIGQHERRDRAQQREHNEERYRNHRPVGEDRGTPSEAKVSIRLATDACPTIVHPVGPPRHATPRLTPLIVVVSIHLGNCSVDCYRKRA
mmetsp:Transcript_25912/g.54482  ORF Transcript_25912/g.54482 Transcript_25912/m.54482 type:complete len:91 (-) Transcript_25912:1288-1560(-)